MVKREEAGAAGAPGSACGAAGTSWRGGAAGVHGQTAAAAASVRECPWYAAATLLTHVAAGKQAANITLLFPQPLALCTLCTASLTLPSHCCSSRSLPRSSTPAPANPHAPAPRTAGVAASGTGSGSSCGACSNSESSTFVTIFLTPRPVPLPAPGLREASRRPLAAGARGALAAAGTAGAAGAAGAAAAAAVAAAAPLLAAATGAGGMLPHICCGDAVGDPGSAPSLAASFSSCLRYSCAAREVYLASILSLPTCWQDKVGGQGGKTSGDALQQGAEHGAAAASARTVPVLQPRISAAAACAWRGKCHRSSHRPNGPARAPETQAPARTSSQPCCLKKVRPRWLPPTAISRSWSSLQVSRVVDLQRRSVNTITRRQSAVSGSAGGAAEQPQSGHARSGAPEPPCMSPAHDPLIRQL